MRSGSRQGQTNPNNHKEPPAEIAATTTTTAAATVEQSKGTAGVPSPAMTKEDAGSLVSVASAVLSKYRRVAVFVTGDAGATPEAIAPWLDARLLEKNVLRLCRVGLRPAQVSSVIAQYRSLVGRRGGAGAGRDTGVATSSRELDEKTLRAIVESEASRGKGGRADADAGGQEEAIGVGQGQRRTGPWQKR